MRQKHVAKGSRELGNDTATGFVFKGAKDIDVAVGVAGMKHIGFSFRRTNL